ncbi:MAG: GNAT family N-acetyltransferase [SAR202 cluster bacterium]|nr:GNAT family N-acetyltransferase [SAR202 cluster bacterium]
MPPPLTFLPVTPERWPDMERLFQARGGPKHCWCMVWRPMPAGASRSGSAAKKTAMESLVRGGTPAGIIGYLEGDPAAWCSIAPRPTYRDLGGPINSSDTPDAVWSLACFFVLRRLRGQGVSRQLLDAAIAHARDSGASVVEAYPVAPDSPSYRFMGFAPLFEAAGFERIGAAGSRRQVMRLWL